MPMSAANAPQLSRSSSSTVEGPDMLRELLTRDGLDPNYPTVDGVTLLHELCHKDRRGRTMSHRTFLITIPATLLLLLHMQPGGHLSRVVAETTLAQGELAGLRVRLLADAVAALAVLLTATTLSVYKPWGLTGYGRRVL